ncbi:MAG: extracellular solute-binding protein [Oscillospiraceae bacterium]|jgi:ABC-type glycerol-3-phosphate transport system substrate-binding protein|nr:extracellular solute-binding protein [Oscillospiraceae bacterium]
MKNAKYLLAILLALALALSCAGCESTPAATPVSPDGADLAPTPPDNTEESTEGIPPPTANLEVVLPDIEVTNPTLKVLAHDGLPITASMQMLADAYGLTDVQLDLVNPSEKQTTLQNAVMSGDSYDIYWDDFLVPLIKEGFVQKIDVDMDSGLWAPAKKTNEQFLWNNERYYLMPGTARQSIVYYNKDMLDEAGLEYPTDLFDRGEWDWNKMLELANDLTVDANNDGVPEQYGLGFDEPEHILYTTGKHLVTFSNGTAINNLLSPEMARAVEFSAEMIGSKTVIPSNARQSFGESMVAMVIGHRWYANGYAKLIVNNSVGVAPLPRDPLADGHYTAEEGGGYYIPKSAPNLPGALAACNVFRMVLSDKDYGKDVIKSNIDNFIWSKSMQAEFEKNLLLDGGVMANWFAFDLGVFWNDFFYRPASGEPWETIAAEISPQIDARIADMYSAD